MASITQYGEDEIFYGSIPVYLKSVPGKAVPYVHSYYSPDTVRDNNNMPTKTLSRKDEISHSSTYWNVVPDVELFILPSGDIGNSIDMNGFIDDFFFQNFWLWDF